MPKIAADTNVLVRLLAQDDDVQVELARRQLFASGFVVSATVILEVEWVLRGRFRFGRNEIGVLLRNLVDLDGISFLEPERISQALDWHAAGMDFADALHLAGSSDCDELVTFDRDFARRAQAAPDAIPVRLL